MKLGPTISRSTLLDNENSSEDVSPHAEDLINEMEEEETALCHKDSGGKWDEDLSQTSSIRSGLGANSGSDEIMKHSMNIEKTQRLTVVVSLLVIIMGAIAASAFMYVGIRSAQENMNDEFDKVGADFVERIIGAWNEYEATAKWMHESCRDFRESGITQKEFEIMYKYAIEDGPDVLAAQFVPNITHEERPEIEARYFKLFDQYREEGIMNYTYRGFRGYEPNPDGEGLKVANRTKQPFYFPILFVAPSFPAGLHLDLYSTPWEGPTLEKALNTWTATLTHRFKFVGEWDDPTIGYVIALYHPGVPIDETGRNEKPRDLNNVIVRVNSLMERASRTQSNNLAAYMYDVTYNRVDPEKSPDFLGGIEIHGSGHRDDFNTSSGSEKFNFYQETEFSDIPVHEEMVYQEDIEVGGKTLTIFCTPIDDSFKADIPFFVTFSGCMIFLGSLFLALWMLHNMRRSIAMHRLMTKAAAEAAIVSNLFPEHVRQRLIEDAEARNRVGVTRTDIFRKDPYGNSVGEVNKVKLESYLTSEGLFGSKPIAELHPHATLMFADLVGFTAWSSTRDPSQVFTLLEIIYHSFDNLAKRRGIFKVETVGDCYVAVCGVPDPNKKHASVMARFATDCLYRQQKLVKALESTLGPDTGDLGIRIGLHSGQVTAGVLRGEKGRFQLFGDTMNMASRMESTGIKNKIQCSEETAELLRECGRGKWLLPREDPVKVKGKGDLFTYFLKVISESKASCTESESSEVIIPIDKGKHSLSRKSKMERLVDWNFETFSDLLRKIVAVNKAKGRKTKPLSRLSTKPEQKMVLDEVKDIMALPEYDPAAIEKRVDPDSIELDEEVKSQLYQLISNIASMYHNNPFHNFEHAAHVVGSVVKMATRINQAKHIEDEKKNLGCDHARLEAELHKFTFGIAHDALTHFVVTFGALIHDLDHPGVPNTTLVNENTSVAFKYQNKSVAEQNSVDLSWDLLCNPAYSKLLNCICVDQADYERFRQTLVNIVLATDIMDKELGAARKQRWNVAFGEEGQVQVEESKATATNRKATIVLEHIIQASDVAHTMQHWHIYAKWNERLFHELYSAYKEGRIDKDPSIGWYHGEMGFFDFYILPLAKKLFTCGVFGVSCDEYLNYAIINRKEWEQKGQSMVKTYLRNYHETHNNDGEPKSRDRKVQFQQQL